MTVLVVLVLVVVQVLVKVLRLVVLSVSTEERTFVFSTGQDKLRFL